MHQGLSRKQHQGFSWKQPAGRRHDASCSPRGIRRLGGGAASGPLHKLFSTVEDKMSEGAAKIPGATKTIAKQPLQPRPQVAGSVAAPLFAAAASAQSSEDTAKNKGKMAEKMGHAIAGAAKSVVNQMVHNGPQQHGGAGSSSSSLTEE
eukprot:1529099-Prymnesium_polylepis.3